MPSVPAYYPVSHEGKSRHKGAGTGCRQNIARRRSNLGICFAVFQQEHTAASLSPEDLRRWLENLNDDEMGRYKM